MKDCDIDYCQRLAEDSDYCRPHEAMIELGMNTDRQKYQKWDNKKCDYPSCIRFRKSLGLCHYHYVQYKSGEYLTPTPYTSEWFRYKESLKD